MLVSVCVYENGNFYCWFNNWVIFNRTFHIMIRGMAKKKIRNLRVSIKMADVGVSQYHSQANCNGMCIVAIFTLLISLVEFSNFMLLCQQMHSFISYQNQKKNVRFASWEIVHHDYVIFNTSIPQLKFRAQFATVWHWSRYFTMPKTLSISQVEYFFTVFRYPFYFIYINVLY